MKDRTKDLELDEETGEPMNERGVLCTKGFAKIWYEDADCELEPEKKPVE